MRRSVGVTVAAVIALTGSVFTLLMGVLMLAVLAFAPVAASAQLPSPVFVKVMLVFVSLMYLVPGGLGVFTGIGLWRLRNWARISILVFSVLLMCMAVFSGLLTMVIPFPPSPGRPMPASFVLGFRLFMTGSWLALLGLGIFWLVFFTRAKVKAQFVPALTAGMPSFATGVSSPLTASSTFPMPAVPEASAVTKSARPLSITIIAWLLLAGCAFLPFNFLLHTPAVLFTRLVTGTPAAVWYGALVVIQFAIGYGLLKLKPAARVAAIAYFGFGCLNMAVFYCAPGATARVQALFESEKAMFPWMQMVPSTSQFQVSATPFIVIGVVGGLIGALVPIYFLVTRKQAFEKAAGEMV